MLLNLPDLDFINLGDTPAGYNVGDASKFVKVNTDADGLLFQNIGTGDVSGFDLAVNALIENNTNISYSNIDGRPTDISDLTDTTDIIPSDLSDLTDTTDIIPSDLSDLTDTTDIIPSDLSDLTDTGNLLSDSDTTYDLLARGSGVTNQKIIRLSEVMEKMMILQSWVNDGLSLVRSGNTLTIANTDKGSAVTANSLGAITTGDNPEFTSIELKRTGGSFIDWKK